MAGIKVNAHTITLDGEVKFDRLPLPDGMRRRDVEYELGVALREHDGCLWSAYPTGHPAAEEARLPVGQCKPRLLGFALREAIACRLRELGATAWFTRAGVHGAGLIAGTTVGQFLVEPKLSLAVTDHYGSGMLLVPSARYRWTCRESLADHQLAAVATGRRALKRLGDGPPIGTVDRVDAGTAVLVARGGPVSVNAADYTLLADSSLVSRLGGAEALAAVREASGESTRTGKKNTYRIRDRFRLASELLEKLGKAIDLPGSRGTARITEEPCEVRMENVS